MHNVVLKVHAYCCAKYFIALSAHCVHQYHHFGIIATYTILSLLKMFTICCHFHFFHVVYIYNIFTLCHLYHTLHDLPLSSFLFHATVPSAGAVTFVTVATVSVTLIVPVSSSVQISYLSLCRFHCSCFCSTAFLWLECKSLRNDVPNFTLSLLFTVCSILERE